MDQVSQARMASYSADPGVMARILAGAEGQSFGLRMAPVFRKDPGKCCVEDVRQHWIQPPDLVADGDRNAEGCAWDATGSACLHMARVVGMIT